MIFSLLGNNIDIHGGGTDLIFPHHENELAQAEGAKKGPFVKYWVHNNMFTFGGEKMAKSTGNVSVMRSFLKQYNGEIFKFLVLSSHYRSMTEVSDNKILQCIQALSRIYTFLKTADEKIKALDIISESIDLDSIKTVYDESVDLFELNLEQIQKKYTDKLKAIKWPIEALDKKEISAVFKDIQLATKNIEDNLNDDLNTPAFFAVLFTVIRRFNDKKNSSKWSDKAVDLYAIFARNLILKYGKIMSLFQEPPELFLKEIDNIFLAKNKLTKKEIDTLVKERDRARKNKNFKKADEIRSQLMNMKIEVKDSPEGTTWETKRYL